MNLTSGDGLSPRKTACHDVVKETAQPADPGLMSLQEALDSHSVSTGNQRSHDTKVMEDGHLYCEQKGKDKGKTEEGGGGHIHMG